jgi:ATP-dependent helicase/nuclease subunit B
LRESFARDAGGFINLCAETVDGLAKKAVDLLMAQQGLTPISSSQAAIAFENVYRQLEESGCLFYFARRGDSNGLVRALTVAITELRSFGITGKSIDSGTFVSPEKGRDIEELLCAYEQCLQDRKYIDLPGVLALASEQPADPEDAFYLIPPFLWLNTLERDFIKRRIPTERLIVLQAEPTLGMTPLSGTPAELWPERLVDCSEDEGSAWAIDAGSFNGMIQPGISPDRAEDYYTWHDGDVRIIGTEEASHLLATDLRRDDIDAEDAIPVDDHLTLFHAYGVTNEAREVLRRIIAMDTSLDSVTVAYTGPWYVHAFYILCKRAGFGLTASDGIPACLTLPGKALKGIVAWIRSDYDTKVLRQMLIEGSICLRPDNGEGDLPPLDVAEILRDSCVGWGRKRYSLLAAYPERIKSELADLDECDRKYVSLQEKMALAAQLDSLMQSLLTLVPEPDAADSVDFGKFVADMAVLLRRLARVSDQMDALALNDLLLHLGEIARMASFSLTFESALDRVAAMVDEFSAGASSPKPGALHLTPYRNLHWTGRPNTFVVGLDANSFPGGASQDPVLLDSEREFLCQELPLGRDRPRVAMSEMLAALSSRRGRVCLSYSSLDVVENRGSLPSSLFLQTFRFLKNNPSLDYSDLLRFLGSPAGYCPHGPGQALDETEWWREQVLVGGMANGPALVPQCYRNIERGQVALSARQSATPTEYDGMVAAAGGEIARRGDKITLSCSSIEHLAGCPFAYFLKYVLRLKPPEEVAYDPGQWLEPMERGLLLHELYCNFMKVIAGKQQRVSVAVHKNMMYEMADELIQKYKIATPPPSEVVFNREARDIRDSCDVFLTVEESEMASGPVLFEVPFGLARWKPGVGIGATDSVRIDFGPGASFLLNGQIDRIDRVSKDVYCIWDYKTGSARGYEEHRYLCKGRQVQHALYAIAAEQILKERLGGAPRVESSGYYFPTRRGEGRRAVRQESDRSPITGLMGHLFDILKNGVFLATDDGEACGYCDYTGVCDRERAVPRAKMLVSDAANACLEPWRRLKEFE